MAKEGAKASKQMGGAFAAAPEFAGTMNALTLAQSMQADALKDAKKGQDEAAKGTDGQVEKLEQMKAALAALTNNIMMSLANSGGLEMMMDMFSKLAGFVIGVVIPGIQMLIPIIGKIWNGMTMLLEPIIESVTKTFGGMGDTLSAVDNILNWVFDTLNGVVRGGILIFESLMRGIDTLAGPFNRLGEAIFGVEENTGSFGETLIKIGSAVGTALELFADIIGWTIDNAVIPLVKMFQNYVLPTLESVYQTIKDNLVPILVAAGAAFLFFQGMTIIGTAVQFAYNAVMTVATIATGILAAGMAILSAGVAIVTTAFALLTSPIGLVILAIVATIAIFKKFGGDMQVVSDGLKYLWSGLETFFSALKLGFFKVLDALPGVDFGKEIEEEEKKIVEQKAEREKLADSMSQRMKENRDKKEQERIADEKADAAKANEPKTGLMDDLKNLFGGAVGNKEAANKKALDKQLAESRRQSADFRAGKSGKFGGVGGGVGGGGAGDNAGKNGKDGKEGKPEIQMDYNAGSESLLKQMAEKEGSALAVKPGASPDMAKSTEALKAANAMKGGMEADAQKKKQEEEAKKKTEDEKKKVEEDAKKKKEEEEKNKKPESAETLLAQLNTSMTRLLAHAEQTTKNTYATYDATKGLNKNLYKA